MHPRRTAILTTLSLFISVTFGQVMMGWSEQTGPMEQELPVWDSSTERDSHWGADSFQCKEKWKEIIMHHLVPELSLFIH